MTENQKAIEIIKNCTMLACEYHIKNKCGKDYSERDKDFEEAKKIAISAIEKQISKKPKLKTHCKDGNSPLSQIIGRCPTCKSIVAEDMLWCDDCGQKLDWSE